MDRIGVVHLTAETIRRRVAEMGSEIARDYRDADLLLVSILKGAVIFVADLARAIDLPLELDFMAITSYQQDRGRLDHPAIRFLKDLDQPLEGRDVLVVEDIIDTGLTLHYILRTLALREPRSLEVCTLLDRPYRRLVDIDVRYVGFVVPDDFFVGYGFDYRQLYRNRPDLTHLLL
ncbi:MAG: hypoxanthine phosphoribosyltransferase [Actinobacteria bacterium]|nr:hypoxanthine phosphoribosyltransferase [Actinomycetota bacterium]